MNGRIHRGAATNQQPGAGAQPRPFRKCFGPRPRRGLVGKMNGAWPGGRRRDYNPGWETRSSAEKNKVQSAEGIIQPRQFNRRLLDLEVLGRQHSPSPVIYIYFCIYLFFIFFGRNMAFLIYLIVLTTAVITQVSLKPGQEHAAETDILEGGGEKKYIYVHTYIHIYTTPQMTLCIVWNYIFKLYQTCHETYSDHKVHEAETSRLSYQEKPSQIIINPQRIYFKAIIMKVSIWIPKSLFER